METFEYISMFLYLGAEEKEILVDNSTGTEKQYEVKFRKLVHETIYYDTDDSGSINEKIETTPLDVKIKYDNMLKYYFVRPNICLVEMAPFFVKLGKKGWEVVEFKFASEPSFFCQALLKRRVVIE